MYRKCIFKILNIIFLYFKICVKSVLFKNSRWCSNVNLDSQSSWVPQNFLPALATRWWTYVWRKQEIASLSYDCKKTVALTYEGSFSWPEHKTFNFIAIIWACTTVLSLLLLLLGTSGCGANYQASWVRHWSLYI